MGSFADSVSPFAAPAVIASLSILTISLLALRYFAPAPGPKALLDPVPGLFNTLQFMLNNYKFMSRVQTALRGESILRFNLGPKTVYLVAGAPGIKAMFSREFIHDITNQEQMTRYALPTLYKMNTAEIQRWEQDKSGVTKAPIPGTDVIASRQRLWYNYEHIYSEYLGKPQHMKPLVDTFQRLMDKTLDRYATGEWTNISIREFCRRQVAEGAINAVFGPDLIALTPDFIDRFWKFDEHVFMLVLGLPKWMNSAPSKAHDNYVLALEKWLRHSSQEFNVASHDVDTEWEPRFGGRAVRELFKWMSETGWRQEVIAATLGALAFALNSNSIPTTTWMLMEIVQDTSLLKAVRDEVESAKTLDPVTGKKKLDVQKLVSLPLLQSIWTETLRLRIKFNITRDVKKAVAIMGHTIPAGSMLQAPMMVAHYDETTWGANGHPASEFWAERHIKYKDGSRTYANMAGHNTAFFPFGGGANVCPGRQFAKYEVLLTIALVVSRLDIEFEEWTMDGAPSDRPAQSDLKYCGAGAMPPDRDMRVRWKRID
ncbi:putative cytochrome P450 [Astrocystis sublimbata]|nr:putative cytochrome P450 [Astrocystis sublimbata]